MNSINNFHSLINSSSHIPPPDNNQSTNTSVHHPRKKQKLRLSNILTIATLNINKLSDLKVQATIDLMEDNNIQIMGLTETWKTCRQGKLMFNQFKNYTTFFANDGNSSHGKGV